MKNTFIIILLSLSLSSTGQSITHLDTVVWNTNYEAAISQSKETGKPVLMVFSGSDWCKPCIMLREQILIKPEFSDWASTHVVCISLDFPSQKKNKLPEVLQQQNDGLAARFNPNGLFPLVVVADSNETVIGTLGYLDVSPVEYVSELEKILNRK